MWKWWRRMEVKRTSNGVSFMEKGVQKAETDTQPLDPAPRSEPRVVANRLRTTSVPIKDLPWSILLYWLPLSSMDLEFLVCCGTNNPHWLSNQSLINHTSMDILESNNFIIGRIILWNSIKEFIFSVDTTLNTTAIIYEGTWLKNVSAYISEFYFLSDTWRREQNVCTNHLNEYLIFHGSNYLYR